VSRRAFRSAAVTAALVLPALVGLPVQGSQAAAPNTTRTPIRHLVVMTQEQHSFDNIFGTRSGVDGIPKGVCLPAKVGSSLPCVAPFPLKASRLRPALHATAAAQLASVANGRMNGFVQAQTTTHNDGRGTMGYYRPNDLPVLTELAGQGVLFDRWFSSVPGGSIANRLFAVSGKAVPDTDRVPAAGWPDLPVIFDRLQAAGVSWKVYVEHYEPALTVSTAGPKALQGGQVARVPLLALSRYERSKSLASHITDLDTYFSDLASGGLPAVSWIVTTSSSERPPADPQTGQREVRNLVNALGGSSAWPSSAFLLSYDTSGGWYDHVAPPTVRGAVLGLRVPALLVSPYATPGRVEQAQFDSASVLRFIETNWSVAPLTSRDANATDLAAAMSLGSTPHSATIVGTSRPSPEPPIPNRLLIYATYLTALLAVGLVVGWARLGRHQQTRSGEVLRDTA
jgi:phospholipase C